MTVTLTVSPAELSFQDQSEVTVEVTAPSDVVVEVGDYDRHPDHLQHQYEYRLSRRGREAAIPTPDGKLKWTQRYRMQFFLPGDYPLPGAGASFTPAPTTSSADGSEPPAAQEVVTEPITVTAKDPAGAKPLSAEELRTIAMPAPVELRRTWRWWWTVTIVVVLIGVLFVWLRRSRRAATVAEPPIPAHEWARRQFAALISDDLVRRGLVQEFYYRISGIVRGYVERRFAVAAPEMTTEEFLTTAASDGRFGREHTASLQEFLTACDLVKYARQIPHQTEADRVLQAAGFFVEQTRVDRPEAARGPALPEANGA